MTLPPAPHRQLTGMSLSFVGVVEEHRRELARTGNRRQTRKKRCKSVTTTRAREKIRPLLPDFSAISAVSAMFPPKHAPPCKGSYNSRRHWNETPGASQALTAAHHLNLVNHSSLVNHNSDVTKHSQTLVNARKRSYTLVQHTHEKASEPPTRQTVHDE